MGAKLARDLLDSDCESCSGRRRTSHATAAERAADYVKRVRERLVARRLREQAAAKEGDDEDKPLGKRGPEDPPDGEGGLEGRVGTAFSLEGGAAGSAATRRKPTMEVILDSGASHNVMSRDIYQRLLSQGRATPLAPVEAPLSFTTASGQSLKNHGSTELFLSGPSPDGRSARCRCTFHVADVKRCLLSTGRVMEKGNALVFANKRADLFLADGGVVTFPVKGSPRATFEVLRHPHRQQTA